MDMTELFQTRRSYRRFDQTRPVPEAVLQEILEAARTSSSAMNRQPLRYTVVASREKVEEIFPMTHWGAQLPKGVGQPKDGEHPTLFIIVLQEKDTKNPYIQVDAGIAMTNMTMAAWNRGVGSCIIGNVERSRVKLALGIPDTLEIVYVVAFGYPTVQSHIVPVVDGNTKYYLDVNRDYCVPKRDLQDIVTRI